MINLNINTRVINNPDFFRLLKTPVEFFHGYEKPCDSNATGKARWKYGAQILRVQHFIIGRIRTAVNSGNPVIYFKPGVIEAATLCSSAIIHHVRAHRIISGIKFIKHYDHNRQISYSEVSISEQAIKWILGSHWQPFYSNRKIVTNLQPKVVTANQKVRYVMEEPPPDNEKTFVEIPWDPES